MRQRRHIWSGLASSLGLLLLVASGAEAQLARELGLLPSDTTALVRAPVLPTEGNFAQSQLRNERVLDARIETRFNIKRLFHERGIRYPAAEVFVRIFKRERSLELWVRPTGEEQFKLLKNYGICALAGELGPKRRQGDNQVPEGFYFIDFFNPRSDFHLSLHVDYPNIRDRMLAPEGVPLGGDIYIHGGCKSAGCLAVTDDEIKELYWIAVEARAAGQHRIPVHIFPARLETEALDQLQRAFAHQPGLGAFWASLKPGYDFFEQNRKLPALIVDARGDYVVTGPAANASMPLAAPFGAPAARSAVGAAAPRKQPLGAPSGG